MSEKTVWTDETEMVKNQFLKILNQTNSEEDHVYTDNDIEHFDFRSATVLDSGNLILLVFEASIGDEGPDSVLVAWFTYDEESKPELDNLAYYYDGLILAYDLNHYDRS